MHRPARHLPVVVVNSHDVDPWPEPEQPKPAAPASVMLCGHCGKTIYWRRPNTKLRLAGGWKHEATGFAGCGYGALTTATPREED